MIKTSYYDNHDIRDKENLVAISNKVPSWFRGDRFKCLVPPMKLRGLPPEVLREQYHERVLRRLNAKTVADMLNGKIILDWPRPLEFSLRRIVAEWIEAATGQRVPELGFEDTQPAKGAEQLDLFT